MAREKAIQPPGRLRLRFVLLTTLFMTAAILFAQYPSRSQISKDGTAVLLEDYASLPLSSPTHGGVTSRPIDYKAQLGRVTSLHSEPVNAPLTNSRFFVDDQSSTLYILDKNTKKFTPYLNFAGIFPKFVSDAGNTAGIVSFVFDPAYAKNGKFYTVHTEKPDMQGVATPTNANLSTLDLKGYSTTQVVNPPVGPAHLESVLVEWTDTNIRDSAFEGTAREILRTGYDRNHPMADLIFNPLARPGEADYGNLYISIGDGAAGETPGPSHNLPQRLDTLVGKILRITPNIDLRPKDMISENGRYRIPSSGPDPNPFVSAPGARGEIYAYGLRNPHRLQWDVESKALIADDIGVHYWEEVNIITKGGNYGYAEREGNEQFFVNDAGKTGSLMTPPVPFPENDLLQVDGLKQPVAPLYPVAVYSHREGDSISNGFVYRGKLMPQLRGKYIFNDMTTGRIFYADLGELLAARGKRNQQAAIHELQIMYRGSRDTSIHGAKRRMFDIVAETFAARGGMPAPDHVLPGNAAATTRSQDLTHAEAKADSEGVPYGGGRADTRMALGGDGELYVLSKSDGMIRKLTAVVAPPRTSNDRVPSKQTASSDLEKPLFRR
jgi:Glucose / Sorbosone dehydrogenase